MTKLFSKLKQADVGDTFFDDLKAMYYSAKHCVKVAKGYADPISTDRWLKQGYVPGPVLFNPFTDYINKIFNQNCVPFSLMNANNNHFLYADDSILISSSPRASKTV